VASAARLGVSCPTTHNLSTEFIGAGLGCSRSHWGPRGKFQPRVGKRRRTGRSGSREVQSTYPKGLRSQRTGSMGTSWPEEAVLGCVKAHWGPVSKAQPRVGTRRRTRHSSSMEVPTTYLKAWNRPRTRTRSSPHLREGGPRLNRLSWGAVRKPQPRVGMRRRTRHSSSMEVPTTYLKAWNRPRTRTRSSPHLREGGARTRSTG